MAALLLASLVLRSRKAVTPIAPSVAEVDVNTPLEDIVTPTTEPTPEPAPEPVLEPEPTPAPLDSDADGLTDDEEAILGTSSASSDTDADGLTDLEEVKTWGTNPLNPDTDGDTYLDGAEVSDGYNPKGPGKITEVPTN